MRISEWPINCAIVKASYPASPRRVPNVLLSFVVLVFGIKKTVFPPQLPLFVFSWPRHPAGRNSVKESAFHDLTGPRKNRQFLAGGKQQLESSGGMIEWRPRP